MHLHVEQERELAADAVLLVTGVVEQESPETLDEVEDLEHGVAIRVGKRGFDAAKASSVVPVKVKLVQTHLGQLDDHLAVGLGQETAAGAMILSILFSFSLPGVLGLDVGVPDLIPPHVGHVTSVADGTHHFHGSEETRVNPEQ